MPTRSSTLRRKQRQAARRAGRRAKITAWIYYSIEGYYCLDRRVRTLFGEIDLVMKRGRRLAYIKVKFRTNREMNNDFGIFLAKPSLLSAASTHYKDCSMVPGATFMTSQLHARD